MIHRHLACSGAVIVGLFALPALAVELRPASHITEVTVFPDRAEIVRRAEVDLLAGSHSLHIADLPAGLLPDSVRVEAVSEAGLMVGAVETLAQFTAEAASPAEREVMAAINALEQKQRELVDKATAARVQLDFVGNVGKALPERAGDDIVRGLPDPEVWRKSWTVLAQGADEALAAIRALDTERQRVERELEARRAELERVRTGQRATLEAVVALEASSGGRAAVELRYQVPGATWRPLYEARLDSGEDSVRLIQRGEVQQATGEEWPDVVLTLSTARPASATEMPRLEPWFVDVLQRTPRPVANEAFQSMRAAPKASADLAEATAQVLAQVRGEDESRWGVYHMTNAGETSWHGFAEAIQALDEFDETATSARLLPIPGSDYPTPARRPLNSRLDNDRLEQAFGLRLRNWREALALCMGA